MLNIDGLIKSNALEVRIVFKKLCLYLQLNIVTVPDPPTSLRFGPVIRFHSNLSRSCLLL